MYSDSSCVPMSQEVLDNLFNQAPSDASMQVFSGSLPNLTMANLHQVNGMQKQCPPGFQRLPLLEPAKRCSERFQIKPSEDPLQPSSSVMLEIFDSDYRVPEENFCLNVLPDLTFSAEICRRTPNNLRFR